MFQPALCSYAVILWGTRKVMTAPTLQNKVPRREREGATASHQSRGRVEQRLLALQGSQEISETHLLEYQIKTRNFNKAPTQRMLKHDRDKKMHWFEACKNTRNGFLSETLRAVTALFRKLSPSSEMSKRVQSKDPTTQITQNSCIKLVDLGLFLSDTVLDRNEQIHWQCKKIVTNTSQVNC